MAKVRFLTDLYDLATEKFHTFNDVVEVSEKRAKDLAEKGYVDILKEEKKPQPKKEVKPQPKKTTKKETKAKKK